MRAQTKSTPLILASYWGHSGVVEDLLRDNQTDVNAQDKDKWTALHEASNKGHSKVVEVLLQRQANVGMGKDDERTPLHLASKKGNEDIVKQLLKAEANVDVKDKDGKTALHLASGAGPEDYSKHEGERGPDDLSSDERWMAQFCTGQHAAVVKLLLERGAKPDAKTNQNETALHLAAARGDPTRLQLILDKMEPGHISIKNDQGKTALYLACTGDSPKPAVERLLESDKLRTAEFGRSDGEDDEIKWAANYPETHEIAKWLMEERLRRKEMAKPEESDNWSVIGWAAYSQLPEVLSPLIAQSRGSSELQAALESALELTLQSVHKPGEDAEQSKLPEVLSLLIIANSPLKSHIEAVLKEALDLTLGLALVNEVKQGAGHRQLFQVLTLLIATFSGTTEIEKALKSTLELVKTPKEGMTDENLSQVLWLLIANSPPTPDIKEALESSWKSASELLEKTDDQPQDSEAALIPPKISNDEAEASSRKGKNKDQEKPEHKREMSMQTTRAAKDHQTNYRHAIADILRAPPLLQTHKDGGIDGPPQPNATLLGILGGHEATIVQFYKGDGESETFRRYRSLKEVIYDRGPGIIMEETSSALRKILGELADPILYLHTGPRFTWVHLPATNMVWMNDILLRIMNDEKLEPRQYHKLKSFFRDSWVQVPDRTSPSRSMRPRTVVMRQENEAGGKHDTTKKEEGERSDKGKKELRVEENKKEEDKEEEDKKREDRGQESSKAKDETKSEESQRKKYQPDFGVASATYMPYFCFSTYYKHGPSPGQKQHKSAEMKKEYERLDDSKSSVIHESPTLDEWYYQFATDKSSKDDRDRRNESQVVTRAMKGRESTKAVVERTKEGKKGAKKDGKKEPGEWTLIRVNQLWAWTIADKWLITTTPCSFDDSNGPLVEGVLEQLGKEIEAGGSASQPEPAAAMSRFVVDYCTGSYERLSKFELQKPRESKPEEPEPQARGSIRQIFSNAINKIGREEKRLFEEFGGKMERLREQIPSGVKKTTKKASSSADKTLLRGSPKGSPKVSSDEKLPASIYAYIRDTIIEAEKMYCDIKDIRDELNILKSAAQHQKTVEEGLTGGSLDVDLAAAYVVKDLKEMDDSAERIQSAASLSSTPRQHVLIFVRIAQHDPFASAK